jgi:hypothetical protein
MADNEPARSIDDLTPETPQKMLSNIVGMLDRVKEDYSLIYTGEFAVALESGSLLESNITRLTANMTIGEREESFRWYLERVLVITAGSNFELLQIEPFSLLDPAVFEAHYSGKEEPYFTIELRTRLFI